MRRGEGRGEMERRERERGREKKGGEEKNFFFKGSSLPCERVVHRKQQAPV